MKVPIWPGIVLTGVFALHGAIVLGRAQENALPPQSHLHEGSPAGGAIWQGWRFVESRQYPEAERELTNYLKVHGDSADAHFLLGYVYYREQRPKDSLGEYTAGARFRRPEANDLAVVAMDYILLRDFADADKWLTTATQWRPENALYWYYLGRTKNNEFQFKDAVDAFRHCLALDPKDLRAEYNLGLAYAGLGRKQDAELAYKTAIEWQANMPGRDPQPYLDLGKLLLEDGHPDQSISYLQEALKLDNKNPTIHEQLGRALEGLGRLKSAETEFNQAITLAPDVLALHYELGRIYNREGMMAKAKEEFARCAALNTAHLAGPIPTPNPISHQ